LPPGRNPFAVKINNKSNKKWKIEKAKDLSAPLRIDQTVIKLNNKITNIRSKVVEMI
jgi:hypothetical protein